MSSLVNGLTASMIKPLLLILALASTAFAGQLDIAIVQYASAKDASQLASSFASSNLADIIVSGNVSKADEYINGGSVIFAQTIPASPGSRLSTSTRLGEERVDVRTALNGLKLSANISIFSGVQQALRSFTERNYSGEGDLTGGRPTIIAIHGSSGKSATHFKGRVSIKLVGYTTLIVAQYR